MNNVRKTRLLRRITMVRLLLSTIVGGMGYHRAKILKKSGLFHHFGDNVYYHPYNIPTEPMGVSIGNNVVICTGVNFITHDVIHRMLNNNPRYCVGGGIIQLFNGYYTS